MMKLRVIQLTGLSYPQNTLRIDERNIFCGYLGDDGLYICASIYCTRRRIDMDMGLEPEIQCEIFDSSGKLRYTKISRHIAKFSATMNLSIPIKIHNLSDVFPNWKTKARVIKLRIVFRDPRDGSPEFGSQKSPLSAA